MGRQHRDRRIPERFCERRQEIQGHRSGGLDRLRRGGVLVGSDSSGDVRALTSLTDWRQARGLVAGLARKIFCLDHWKGNGHPFGGYELGWPN